MRTTIHQVNTEYINTRQSVSFSHLANYERVREKKGEEFGGLTAKIKIPHLSTHQCI